MSAAVRNCELAGELETSSGPLTAPKKTATRTIDD
jgi:hypothetical protein